MYRATRSEIAKVGMSIGTVSKKNAIVLIVSVFLDVPRSPPMSLLW